MIHQVTTSREELIKQVSAAIVLLADDLTDYELRVALSAELTRRQLQTIAIADVNNIHAFLSILETYKNYQSSAYNTSSNAIVNRI